MAKVDCNKLKLVLIYRVPVIRQRGNNLLKLMSFIESEPI